MRKGAKCTHLQSDYSLVCETQIPVHVRLNFWCDLQSQTDLISQQLDCLSSQITFGSQVSERYEKTRGAD